MDFPKARVAVFLYFYRQIQTKKTQNEKNLYFYGSAFV
jgi:hypothetical protein